MRSKLIFIFFLLFFTEAQAQETPSYSILFYNTENLFDWKDDPTVNDNEFTADGERHWTYKRFQKKIANTAKALLATFGWDIPVAIGVSEVENRYVLEQLISETPLKSYPFKIIHKESPDPRGIDVAMIYNSKLFHPVHYEYFALLNEDGTVRKTREILYVEGRIGMSDTVHVFINHWPSRYTGLLETKEWRNKAAALLKQKTDSLFSLDNHAKIVIMGDFNDQPFDQSIRVFLQALAETDTPEPGKLYNFSSGWNNHKRGTLKYQAQWFVFDQIIVSGELLTTYSGVYTRVEWASISDVNFLLEPDERYGGEKTNRTYNGFQYHGGFADHLPVKLKLEIH